MFSAKRRFGVLVPFFLAIAGVAHAGETATSESETDDPSDTIRGPLGDALPGLTPTEPAKHATPATEPPTKIDRVIVLDFVANDVGANLAKNLSEVLVGRIRARLPGATVIGQDEIITLLSFAENQQLVGCDDTECLAAIGGALGADHLVNAKVGKIGKTYVITLKLLSVSTAEVVGHKAERVEDEDAFIDTVLRLGRQLIDEALGVQVGGMAGGLTETVRESWYEKWWVWTVVGAVVAGTAVGLGVGLTQGSGGGGGDGSSLGGGVRIEVTP